MELVGTMKLTRGFFKELVHGGHLQSLGAAGIAGISAALFKIPFTWDCFLAVYMLFYPLYLYNRYREIDHDGVSNPQRTRYLNTYVDKMPFILGAVIIINFVLIKINSSWNTVLGSAIILGFGLLYTDFFKSQTKKVALFKNVYVALFFAALVFYPFLYYGNPLTETALVAALLFFLFVYFKAFNMQIFLDIKDIEGDKQKQLLTLPVIMGKEKVLSLYGIVSILSSLVFPFLFFASSAYHVPYIWFFVLSIPFNYACIMMVEKGSHNGYALASSEFSLWAIFLLFIVS